MTYLDVLSLNPLTRNAMFTNKINDPYINGPDKILTEPLLRTAITISQIISTPFWDNYVVEVS